MIDEILIQVFGQAALGNVGRSRRAQLVFRIFFGLIGAILGIIGAIHFVLRTGFTTNSAFRFCIVSLFVFLASFSLFNIAFARKWRWPAVLFALSFVAMFLSRILFGA